MSDHEVEQRERGHEQTERNDRVAADRTSADRAAAGRREADRDHTLTRLDQDEVRDRMRQAQERFVQLGVAVYLIAVRGRRGNVQYSIELRPDGAKHIPMGDLQDVADEYSLDLAYSGEAILVDPRPKPNWSHGYRGPEQ
jgi:hypothetical protein